MRSNLNRNTHQIQDSKPRQAVPDRSFLSPETKSRFMEITDLYKQSDKGSNCSLFLISGLTKCMTNKDQTNSGPQNSSQTYSQAILKSPPSLRRQDFSSCPPKEGEQESVAAYSSSRRVNCSLVESQKQYLFSSQGYSIERMYCLQQQTQQVSRFRVKD